MISGNKNGKQKTGNRKPKMMRAVGFFYFGTLQISLPLKRGFLRRQKDLFK